MYPTGLTSNKSEDILSFLKDQSAETIQKSLLPMDNFHPVIDGAVLRADCVISCTNEKSVHIPYMNGCNSCEGALIVQMMLDFQMPNMEACKNAIMLFFAMSFNVEKLDIAGMTTALMEYFAGASDEDLLQRYTEMVGDAWFVAPCVLASDSHCSKIQPQSLLQPFGVDVN